MITKVKVEASYVEAKNEFLKGIQKCIADSLRTPSIIVDNTPTEQKQAHAIIDSIKENYPGSEPTLVLPGVLIQMIFPEEELLVSTIFLKNNINNSRVIKLELCKLSSVEDK
nr:MAG TPA: hypothetical protein [Caudoviricetes sp.]